MWTQPSDVLDRWMGGEPPATESQILTLLSDAEDTVEREFPDIQDRIDSADLPIERVVKVVCRIVIRHMKNPDGHRTTSQGAGPYQQSITFGGDEPGALYLTDSDRKELAGVSSLKGKAFSVDMTPQAARQAPDVWGAM